MRSLGILIKKDFDCLLGALQGKKNRKKNSIVIALVVLVYLGICAVIGLQNFGLYQTMKLVPEIPIFNSIQIALLMSVILAFQTMTGKSKTTDSDLLLSLPIKKIDIVISKAISKYLFAGLLIGMIIIPSIFLYSIFISFSITVILWLLLFWIIMPFVSVGLTYIIDFLTIRLFNRLNHSGLYKTIFAVVLFGLFAFFYIKNSLVLGTMTDNTVDGFLNTNFFVGWSVKVIVRNDFICLIWVMLSVAILSGIGITLYSIIFGKSYMSYKSKKQTIDFIEKKNSTALISKELKKYFTTPIYVVNTIISPIMIIVLTVVMLVWGDNISVLLGAGKEQIFALLTLVNLVMASMTQISCVSISLEGKQLWILRSSPISVKNIFLAKVSTNMILFLPVHLISSIILSVVYSADLVIAILYILIPIVMILVISFGGLYINLLSPKLDWDNEATVVKSSLSVTVSMFASMFVALIPVIFNLLELSIYLTGFLTLGLYLILFIVIISLLFTKGIKRFNNLVC